MSDNTSPLKTTEMQNLAISDMIESVVGISSTEGFRQNKIVNILKNNDFNILDLQEVSKFNSILEDRDTFKVFLTLFIKGFTWNRELRNSFDLHPDKIRKTLSKLKSLALVVGKEYYYIDPLYQEVIFLGSPDFKNWIIADPHIYAITEKGKEWGLSFAAIIKELSSSDEEMYNSFQYVNQKCAASREMARRIVKKEYSSLWRIKTCPYSGVQYESPTEWNREFAKQFGKAYISSTDHLETSNKTKKIILQDKRECRVEEDEEHIGIREEDVDNHIRKRQALVLDMLGIQE